MEEWRMIPGTHGMYEVSSQGRVRSWINRGRYGGKASAPRLCRAYLNERGYPKVRMCIGVRRKVAIVHRLVAEAFIPNPAGLPTVNHKNGEKLDNRASNLEWVTVGENIRHGFATGILGPESRQPPFSKLNPQMVRVMRRAYQAGLSVLHIAAVFNVSEAHASHTIRGIYWASVRHGGPLHAGKERGE